MPNLFNHNLLKNYIQNHHIDNFDRKFKLINDWKRNLKTIMGVNEKALQAAFLKAIFGNILGYKGIEEAGTDGEWNLNIETSTEVDATTPDGIMGFYTSDNNNTQAVIELKSPKVSLDKKQKRAGKDYGTPVEQAFSYVSKYDRCNWIIVSNMNEIRLYKAGRSQEYYESFFMEELDNEKEFKKFHLLLCKDNLIKPDGKSKTLELSERTKEHIQDISIKFYNLYKNIRIELLEELKENNPGYDKELLLEKAQKFLDRVIFICFCEDLGLLPNDLLHKAIKRGRESFSPSETIVWEEIKGVFRAIDIGNEAHDIPAYDGGLFEYDEALDGLVIKNDFFDAIYDISAYDFASDLDVNILGHIFEQSISDIEELKANIQEDEYDAQKSRRKKDGIYYTPGYITKYIVENSLGKYLEDIKKELGEENLPDFEAASTPQQKGRYRKQLLKFYEEYEERVKNVKVLDPACGSGAFLNQAFDFLLEEYRWIHKQISTIKEGQMSIFDLSAYQRSVLKNNLYGVDLNEESVEITKLSLWLKTADSKNPLPYLDDNIKCGNSLIDDPEVAGDKAFDWGKEFAEIMKNGGFDVVIGNPPYGVVFTKEEKKYLEKYDKLVPDYEIYVYFVSKGLDLLKDRGYLSYIFPNTFLANVFGIQYRESLLDNYRIENIVNLSEDDTFKDAKVRTCIFTLIKSNTSSYNTTYFSSIESLDKLITAKKEYTAETLRNNISNWLALFYHTGKDTEIIKKIINCELRLKNICKISQGLIPYDKYRGHSKEIIKNRVYHANYKKDETFKKELQGGDVKSYFVEWNGETWISYGNWLAAPRKQEYFTQPRLLIREIATNRLHCCYTEEEYYNTPSIINIIQDDTSYSLKYLLAILNSKLIAWYYLKTSPKAKKGLFPKIIVKDVNEIPIPKADWNKQKPLIEKAEAIMSFIEGFNSLFKKCFSEIYNKYTSKYGLTVQDIINKESFSNYIYNGKAKKIQNLAITINDTILTIYNNQFHKTELIKFEIKDKFQRQYIKLYLENLTEEQLDEINKYNGNILEKVLKIEIPDYDKPEVVRRIINEWNQLQKEIKELVTKIKQTDREIDQLVYELYGLTGDEVKIVEESV